MLQKYKKYKKPLLIFFGSLVILGSLGLISFLAFNFGRSQQQAVLITRTPAPETGSPEEALSEEALSEEPTANPTQYPIAKASPTIKPSPVSTATPVPTGAIFNAEPLVLLKPSETQVLEGNATLGGYRASDNSGSNTERIWVGRDQTAIFRGFVSFDLKSLPGNITIEKAILEMWQTGQAGKPYVVGGNVVVDHLDYGTSLESSDYNRVAIKLHIGVLTDNATVEEKKLEVTDSVKNDLYYKRDRSQYRLRFATETIGGTTADITVFYPEKKFYPSQMPPRLEITYKKN